MEKLKITLEVISIILTVVELAIKIIEWLG